MAEGPPNRQLPPVKTAQVAQNAHDTATALQRKATNEAAPAATTRQQPRPTNSGDSDDIIAQYTRPRAPAIPEGAMTLAELADKAGVRLPGDTRVAADGDTLDEDAGWSSGRFLRERTTQVRKTGAGLAAAAIGKMKPKQ